MKGFPPFANKKLMERKQILSSDFDYLELSRNERNFQE